MDIPESLILAYLGETASEQDVERLFEWVGKRPENAAEFARMVSLNSELRMQLSGARTIRESGFLPVVTRPDEFSTVDAGSFRSRTRWRRLAYQLAMAACLTVATALLYKINRTDPPVVLSSNVTFATLSHTVNAKWVAGNAIQPGQRLGSRTLRLQQGFARLHFDDGVKVTLKGPSEFTLISARYSRLENGMLTAIVPKGAEGFVVDTPHAEVVDLGTAFGVECDQQGNAKVLVFDGEVKINPVDDDSSKLVKEGEAIWLSDDSISEVNFNPEPFQKMWPVSSGIVRSTGDFEFAPQWPTSLHRVQNDSTVFVVQEGYATRTNSEIVVDITQAGKYRTEEDLSPGCIPPGTKVKSFLLQFNPVSGNHGRKPTRPATVDQEMPKISGGLSGNGEKGRPELKYIRGEITFDRPVIGLIVKHENLDASDEIFTTHVRKNIPARGLELWSDKPGDVVTLSADRRTVRLELASIGRFFDHVRVIVEDSPSITGIAQAKSR